MFQPRDGVTFSSGNPLTSADVAPAQPHHRLGWL